MPNSLINDEQFHSLTSLHKHCWNESDISDLLTQINTQLLTDGFATSRAYLASSSTPQMPKIAILEGRINDIWLVDLNDCQNQELPVCREKHKLHAHPLLGLSLPIQNGEILNTSLNNTHKTMVLLCIYRQ